MRGEMAEIIKGNNSVNSLLSSTSEECQDYTASRHLGNGFQCGSDLQMLPRLYSEYKKVGHGSLVSHVLYENIKVGL